MKLVPLMTYRAEIAESHPIGETTVGNRSIARVIGGSFEGPDLKGDILEPAADWILNTADGFGQVDVRLVFRTDDDAYIDVRYTGLLERTEGVNKALLEGESTNYGDNYFVTQIRFATGAERYQWLNQIVAVGEGRLLGRTVEYRCFKVLSSAD